MNILITGGSSGLGKATVELLAKDGHEVYFTFLSADSANEITSKYKNTHAIALDFYDDMNVDKFCDLIKTIDLDILVNSAYAGEPQSNHFHKINGEDFLKSFQFNLIPTIKITQSVIEVFRKKRFGKIINILTSYIMNLPPTGFATYVCNKAYLEKISDVINKEYSNFNITSNCILPEFMNTGFGSVDSRMVELTEMQHPLKKLLAPEEVAKVVKFFVDASQHVNGVKIPINSAINIKN